VVIDEGINVAERSFGGQPQQSVVSPPIRTTMLVETAPQSQSVIAFSARISSVEMLPAAGTTPPESTGLPLQQIVGMTASGKITDRGLPLGIQVSIPPGLPDSLTEVVTNKRDTMKEIAVQLPAEAVGLGARWERDVVREWSGIPVRFTGRYEVRELTNRKVLLEVSVEATSGPLHVKIPNLPEGATALIESASGTGSGKVQFDMETLIHRSQVLSQTRIALKVTLKSGQVMDIQMTTRQETSVH
jgi:hypothetical protein